jgi:hypothetical protein
MDIQLFETPKGLPFCIVRNYFNPDEVKFLLKELQALRPRLCPPAQTGTAHDGSGQPKKSNRGLFLDSGEILNLNRKLFHEVAWEASKLHWFFRILRDDVKDSTLVSYYETGDYYKSHYDKSLVTATHYVWEEPKKFEGGDLCFGEYKVPITNNCLVIFPGTWTEHEVTPVTGTGRWAISQFVHQKEQGPNVPIRHFPNFLNVLDFKKVQEHLTNSDWKFKGLSTREGGRFWYLDLMDVGPFREYIKGLIEQAAGRKFVLNRVYANGQAYGQDGDYHQDDTDPKAWTFLLYTNDIPPDKIDEWSGMTLFKTELGIMCQPPVTNLGVLFRSDLWHKGLGPAKHIKDLRMTVAWKLLSVE